MKISPFFFFFVVILIPLCIVLFLLADHKRRDASLTVALRTVSALHNGCCVVKKGKDDYDDVNQKTRILSFMEVLHAEDWTKSDYIKLLHHC